METLIRNILNQVKLQKIYARETAQVVSIPKHRAHLKFIIAIQLDNHGSIEVCL